MGGELQPDTGDEIMSETRQFNGGINVFGIWLDSRHGRLRELWELIEFAELAQARSVAKYIKSVWYDSNGAVAEIECHITPEPCDPLFNVVEAVALRTLTTFHIIGDSPGYQSGRRPAPRQTRGNEPGSPVPPAWHRWS